MNKLIIALITTVSLFFLLFLGAQLDYFSLSDPNRITGAGTVANGTVALGSTDGLIILATLAFIVILIPIAYHFRLVKRANQK